MYRHGDVLLVPAPGWTPEHKAGLKSRSGDSLILARGEATGHAHRATGQGLTLDTWGSQRYLTSPTPAQLTHEEHRTITLPPGTYELLIQRTYQLGMTRRVRD